MSWKIPDWMKPYRDLIETDGYTAEGAINCDGKDCNTVVNGPRALMCCEVAAKVRLINKLREAGLLKDRGPAPKPKSLSGKGKPLPGHGYDGNAGFEVSCECGHRFNAKYLPARRRMWREHVEEVRARRKLRADFETLMIAAESFGAHPLLVKNIREGVRPLLDREAR